MDRLKLVVRDGAHAIDGAFRAPGFVLAEVIKSDWICAQGLDRAIRHGDCGLWIETVQEIDAEEVYPVGDPSKGPTPPHISGDPPASKKFKWRAD